MFKRIAARPKCSSSARATRYFKCRNSIFFPKLAQDHERHWLLPVFSSLLLYRAHLSEMYWRPLQAENYNTHGACRGSQDLRGFRQGRWLCQKNFTSSRAASRLNSSTSALLENPAIRRETQFIWEQACTLNFGGMHDSESGVVLCTSYGFELSISRIWRRTRRARGNCRR